MGNDGGVLASTANEDGIAVAREAGFHAILEEHLARLDAPSDLPVVICGMAGSRQGWKECGYLEVPAELDDLWKHVAGVNGLNRPVTILPGISQAPGQSSDVMRGEETKLFGASMEGHGAHTYCIPGQHSKWALMAKSQVQGFRTFMTGEMIDVLSRQTILQHSLEGAAEVEAGDPAFSTGVRDGWLNADKLTSTLFSIRAGDLLEHRSPDENLARLTGLMIGAELAGAEPGSDGVALVASGQLAQLYQSAFATCGIDVRLIDAEIAVQRGLFEVWRALISADNTHARSSRS